MTQQEFEEKFFELYKQGLSTTDICNQLGENRHRGYSLLRRKGLKSNPYKSKKYTPEFLEQIKQEYLNGVTVEQLQEKYPDKKGSINEYLRKMGITRPNGKVAHCNYNYFSNIDTPQKAYFLGLLTADGCVRHTKENQNSWSIRLELKVEDKYIIEEFARAIESNLQVKEYQQKEIKHNYNGKVYISNKHNAYFMIYSTQMAQDLIKWGCTPNKYTSRIIVPNIDEKFLRYYLLGFYDGDGIACAGKKQYMGFVGNKEMMESVCETIEKLLCIPKPAVYYNRFSHIYFVQYYKKEDMLKLFHFFYDNLTIPCLIRKYNKMKQALGL